MMHIEKCFSNIFYFVVFLTIFYLSFILKTYLIIKKFIVFHHCCKKISPRKKLSKGLEYLKIILPNNVFAK